MSCRDVVERRVYTVTGQQPAQEDVERLIETGESETIFQTAIMEQGRGQVPCQSYPSSFRTHLCPLSLSPHAW